MAKNLNNLLLWTFLTTIILSGRVVANDIADKQWANPFVSTGEMAAADTMTLQMALNMVARANPALKAGRYRIEAAQGSLGQAGIWPNPELEIEVEEVGLDAPGFRESGFTASLSQEIELWGKRGNRRNLAQRELEAVEWAATRESFEIYAVTAERFVALGHAQERIEQTREAARLTEAMVESARRRVDCGAAMSSELLLAELEFERASLELTQTEAELTDAQDRLAALWNGESPHLVVALLAYNPATLSNLVDLDMLVDRSGGVLTAEQDIDLVLARLNLEKSESKPNLSISGGFKRAEANGSNSLVFGVGLPLPFFNRNQGTVKALAAEAAAVRLDREQALLEARLEFKSIKRQIVQSRSRYRAIDAVLLPHAEQAYHSLKEAYEKGRLPYSTLLEAQRTLIDLSVELNDLDLSIKQQIITLERLLGITLLI